MQYLCAVQFYSRRLFLNEIKSSDLDSIHKLHSNHQVDLFNTLGVPSGIKTTEKLLQSWVAEQSNFPKTKMVFAITIVAQNDFIGLLGINMGKPGYNSAELWFKIDPACWNQGYATEAVHRTLKLCFEDLELHRVEAGCAVENIAAYRVLEKCGFLREAHCRKLLPIRGQWHDNYGYAILSSDYFEQLKLKP